MFTDLRLRHLVLRSGKTELRNKSLVGVLQDGLQT